MVQNVLGSGGHKPPKYKTWIEYYRRHYKIKHALTCSEYNCNRKDIHGAHVNIYFLNFVKLHHKIYIIPLCPKHNNPKNIETFYVKYNLRLLECDYIQFSLSKLSLDLKFYVIMLLILIILLNYLIEYIKFKLGF